MTNYCDGCRSYIPELTDQISCCSHIEFNQNSKCPCTECIVKVMCLDACQLFADFKIECGNLSKMSSTGRGINQ